MTRFNRAKAPNKRLYIIATDEGYMSAGMLDYFKNKLLLWKENLVQSDQYMVDSLAEVSVRENCPLDDSTNKHINFPQVACIKHKRMLLQQIDAALLSIRNGTYGYCEYTGNPIGIARLESYPTARLCVWAQELLEKSANGNSMDN